MLRFLLRRLPRFGFVTLFAAMLLFVSGAGRFKFEYDLYQEEERLLADLKKAQIDFGYKRYSDRDLPGEQPFWSKWHSPHFDRIWELVLTYERAEDKLLVERVAELPCLQSMTATPLESLRPTTAPPDISTSLESLGLALPEPRDVPIPAATDTLPDGVPLTNESEGEALAAWSETWSRPETWPEYGVLRRIDRSPNRSWRHDCLDVRTRHGAFTADEFFVVFTAREGFSECEWIGSQRQEIGRNLDPEVVEFLLDDPEGSPFKALSGRRKLEHALYAVNGGEELSETLRMNERANVESIQRTEQGLLRIDFHPLLRSYPDDSIEDEIDLRLVLRADRDFTVEAFDIDVLRDDGITSEKRLVSYRYRAASSDHDGRYLPDAVAVDLPVMRPLQGAPDLFSRPSTMRYAYDFAAEPSSALFEPSTFDVLELPPPRPLPFLRWYRVTLTISLALFAFVAGRKIVARFRRATSASPFSVRVETDEGSPAETAAAP